MRKPLDPSPFARRLVRCSRMAGVTLLELLVVVTIAGLLAALATPSLRGAIRSVTLNAASSSILSGLHTARSESIKRNGRVAVCKSVDGLGCEVTGGWEQGWIVFDDRNSNAQREPDEPLIHRTQALSRGVRIQGNLPVSRYLSFTSMGVTRTVEGAFQAGTLTVCLESRDATEARQIVISAVGRPRAIKTSVPFCV